jgi:hypothetical protein
MGDRSLQVVLAGLLLAGCPASPEPRPPSPTPEVEASELAAARVPAGLPLPELPEPNPTPEPTPPPEPTPGTDWPDQSPVVASPILHDATTLPIAIEGAAPLPRAFRLAVAGSLHIGWNGWTSDGVQGALAQFDLPLGPVDSFDDARTTWSPGAPDASLDIVGLDFDLDGDGSAELLVGEPYAVPDPDVNDCRWAGTGRIQAWSSPPAGPLPTGGGDLEQQGDACGDGFGAALFDAGDVDGDGQSDLLVGAPLWSTGGANQGGRAWLLPGGGGLDLTSALATWAGTEGFSRLRARPGGDITGDGRPDVVLVDREVHGGFQSNAKGLVRIAAGPAGGEVAQVHTGTHHAWITGALGPGDVNGDGFGDLLVWGLAGDVDGTTAWLLAGPLPSVNSLDQAVATINLAVPDDTSDWSHATQDHPWATAAAVGDVDGDGHADLWFADPAAHAGRGRAALFLGPVGGTLGPEHAALLAEGSEPHCEPDFGEDDWEYFLYRGDSFGDALAAGDVDGDGIPDLLLSSAYRRSAPCQGSPPASRIPTVFVIPGASVLP